MTVRHPTLCAACVHLRGGQGRVCDAFPGGIPKAIFLFGADHREPRAGDHGTTFQLRDDAAGRQALADWEQVHVVEGGGNGGN